MGPPEIIYEKQVINIGSKDTESYQKKKMFHNVSILSETFVNYKLNSYRQHFKQFLQLIELPPAEAYTSSACKLIYLPGEHLHNINRIQDVHSYPINLSGKTNAKQIE